MDDTTETRERIKEAAAQRFATYGFGKTTMAEIGCDCSMSAANLYNFYKNKQDIAAAITEDHFAREHQVYHAIAQRTDITPPEKIRKFTYTSIELTSECVRIHEKIFELLEFVCGERSDLIEAHIEQKRSIMAEILAEGNRTGDFDIPDIFKTATAVLKGLVFFDHPALMVTCPEETARELADDVVDLILNGLRKR